VALILLKTYTVFSTVEFGAKVNNIQVDGISFIEHPSSNTFNEGTRLQTSIALQERLFNTRVPAVAADAIYATNANRKFCTKNQIYTSFVRKGKPAADETQRKILRSTLSRARAIRLEGSFGTQNNITRWTRSRQGKKKPRYYRYFSVYMWPTPPAWLKKSRRNKSGT